MRSTPTTTPITSARAVRDLLVHEDRPWTIAELARETGDCIGTIDAVAELCGAGLLNHIGADVVCASRAAIHFERIEHGEEES